MARDGAFARRAGRVRGHVVSVVGAYVSMRWMTQRSRPSGVDFALRPRSYRKATRIAPLPQTVWRPTPVHCAASRNGTNSPSSPSYSATPTKPPSGCTLPGARKSMPSGPSPYRLRNALTRSRARANSIPVHKRGAGKPRQTPLAPHCPICLRGRITNQQRGNENVADTAKTISPSPSIPFLSGQCFEKKSSAVSYQFSASQFTARSSFLLRNPESRIRDLPPPLPVGADIVTAADDAGERGSEALHSPPHRASLPHCL